MNNTRFILDRHDRGPRPPLWICRDTHRSAAGAEAFTTKEAAESAVAERNARYELLINRVSTEVSR